MKKQNKQTITLITSNPNKLREFKAVLEPEVKVEHMKLEYPELRSDSPEEIVKLAAKQLADMLGKAVVVEDSGFFIRALSGFPGTCTAYVFKRIGNEGLLRVMKNVKDRACYYKSAIGYCEPGEDAVAFSGVEEGRVAQKVRGKFGWGQDPIFMPFGKRQTYGELRNPKRKDADKYSVNIFRKNALEKLKAFLLDLNRHS